MKSKAVVDALDSLSYVKYSKVAKCAVRCGNRDEPGGIISSDGSKVFHVSGWPALIGYDTIKLYEIEADEYAMLKSLLASGEDVNLDEETQETEPEMDPVDKETLEWAKTRKVRQSKEKLSEYLLRNPLQSAAHGGVMATYTVTEEKQHLMLLNYSTYQIQKAAGIDAILTWNQSGEACEIWTEEEFLNLIMDVRRYVQPLVSKQQRLEKQILGAASLAEVNSIEIDY